MLILKRVIWAEGVYVIYLCCLCILDASQCIFYIHVNVILYLHIVSFNVHVNTYFDNVSEVMGKGHGCFVNISLFLRV